MLLAFLKTYQPSMHGWASEFFGQQKHRFSGGSSGGGSSSGSTGGGDSIVGKLWNGFIALMILYFVLSIVQSMAAAKFKQAGSDSGSGSSRQTKGKQAAARNKSRATLRGKLTK